MVVPPHGAELDPNLGGKPGAAAQVVVGLSLACRLLP